MNIWLKFQKCKMYRTQQQQQKERNIERKSLGMWVHKIIILFENLMKFNLTFYSSLSLYCFLLCQVEPECKVVGSIFFFK